MKSKHEIRQRTANEMSSLLFGPRNGPTEFVEGRMVLSYMTGILFPQGLKRADLAKQANDEDEELSPITEAGQSQDFSGDRDNPLSMANEDLPSSVGISFVIDKGAEFKVLIDGATYADHETEEKEIGFKRTPYTQACVMSNAFSDQSTIIFDGAAKVIKSERKSLFRKNKTIVTISLVNNNKLKGGMHSGAKKSVAQRIYQVGLVCECMNGSFQPYDVSAESVTNLEDQILQLQYKDKPTYAVGHGASVDWKNSNLSNSNSDVDEVSVTYLPKEWVYRPTFDHLKIAENDFFTDSDIFDIRSLATATQSDRMVICQKIESMANYYCKWIDSQRIDVDLVYKSAQTYLLTEMEGCLERMLSAIDLLKNDDGCWKAFTLANLAMLFQIEQTSRLKELRKERETAGQSWPIPLDDAVDPFNCDINELDDSVRPAWRPFQLAFFISTLYGIEHPGSDEHSLVDLIWFSTGGGKTEAYLLLASYELLRRRMRYPSPELGYGVGVITRYTLRFLTADQFNRTASLACALEKIRLLNIALLGCEPFTVGLYLGISEDGGQAYPNISRAKQDLDELHRSIDSKHRFQITECLNCGTSLIPETADYDSAGKPIGFGIRETAGKIEYSCMSSQCVFSKDLSIPVTVIEEEIYVNPPSFLIGTIDKFASLPWKEDVANLFGKRKQGKYVVPPTLIIQDELHLISGPLGTIAGVYEAGFDSLIRTYQKKMGLVSSGSKYVASSATVRDSAEQIQRLMGRPSTIFPPRGISSGDSCFSQEELSAESARLYMGVMAQGLRATTAAHWTSAAISQSVRFIADEVGSKQQCDFLWTLLCYCNSKRELSFVHSAVSQEIYERMQVYAGWQNFSGTVQPLSKEEVSSNNKQRSISEIRSLLMQSVTDHDHLDSPVKEFIPCSNMVSVGIDIDRLGLMLVNGQPKTTSEYIQASSRVGRSPVKQGPGLVITLYSPSKPRDRSHYEHFKSYHQSLNSLVEPTSVTPASEQALDKALHAAYIGLIRHGVPNLGGNRDAKNFNVNNLNIKEATQLLRDRLGATYSLEHQFEQDKFKEMLKKVVDQWSSWVEPRLVYASRDKDSHTLLTNFHETKDNKVGFPTMRSMRGVDSPVRIEL